MIASLFIAGARSVSTLLNEMKRRGKDCRFGVISMCIGLSILSYPPLSLPLICCSYLTNFCMVCAGTGMGAAAVFERGDATDGLTNARRKECHNLLSKDAM